MMVKRDKTILVDGYLEYPNGTEFKFFVDQRPEVIK